MIKSIAILVYLNIEAYMNNEIAQYTSNKAITVLRSLSFLERNFSNTEPNNAQQQVAIKPTKARITENIARANTDL